MNIENQPYSEDSVYRAQARKPYRTPKLTIHGSLKEITKNIGSGAVDFPMGSHLAG
ncbi:MAG: lasso RiPP family leader peptide-containing protein [Bacteroidota bacterium]